MSLPVDASSDSSRRDFLLSAGVFAAGAVMTAPALASQEAPPASAPPQPQPAQPEAPAAGAIDPATIAAAETLAGITFTAEEREVMSRTLREQMSMMASRQKAGPLPNSLAPSLRFDPRIKGMIFEPPPQRSMWSRHEHLAPPANDEDIAFASVSMLSQWIRTGRLTSERLTNIAIERLKHFDPQLKCVITLCEDHARQAARRADAEIAAGTYRGPLHGIPWGAKDLLDTAGIRTTWGAEPFADRVTQTNAAVVRKLDDAGAVLVAKLSLGALAYNDIWFGGRTNNPWNLRQGSSGSSAGSAAAVAAGLVGFAIGTETYGSIISPSMRCGTTGLRPTFGRVSRDGAMALCWSLDKVGPMARSVEDCAMVLDAINGAEGDDPCSIDMPLHFDVDMPIDHVRVGYDPKWFSGASAPDRAALEAMRSLGVQLVEIALPDWPYECLLTMLFCEAAAAFEDLTRKDLDDTLRWQSPQAWPNTFRQSWFIPGIEYVQCDRFRRDVMKMMAARFDDVHVMISPSFAGDLLLITNFTGHPSLTLRDGFTTPRSRRTGVNQAGTQGQQAGNADDQQSAPVRQPTGITLIGRLFDEVTLCRVGLALEQKLDVWRERPPLM